MKNENIQIQLDKSEIEVVADLLQRGASDLQRGVVRSHAGESLMELTDLSTEGDAEYIVELYQGVSRKLNILQNSLKRNDVRFIDQESVFRAEETVHVYQIRGDSVDSLVYIHETRHGAFFFYSTIESLIQMYLDGKESKIRYESETAMEHFLHYWKG
jgi:hypothetical protein